MRFVVFCHSLSSDWNHGNAHFLRGICTELQARGHHVRVYEPRDSWSRTNLEHDAGAAAATAYQSVYPSLDSTLFDPSVIDLDEAVDRADVVLVHEWNDHSLVARIGRNRVRHGRYLLLFHDTHHRSVTDPKSMAEYDLSGYDGVLAFGRSIADRYERSGWSNRVWVVHEAADTRVFCPREAPMEGDLVWIGNWGDEERTAELDEFLVEPVKTLGLRAKVHGVRYPKDGIERLSAAGISYGGYLPNFRVPEVFARYRMTVHVPRRPYASALPGVPTIRIFEALACGIPLVSAPWEDSENLFTPGEDYLVARDGAEMTKHLRALRSGPSIGRALAAHGLNTVLTRHTCAHRANEICAIVKGMQQPCELEAAGLSFSWK